MGEWFESGEPWYPAKWGADDELGTLNTLTAERVRAASGLVRTGRVYRLGHLIFPEMPIKEGAHGSFLSVISNRPYDAREGMGDDSRNRLGATHCRLELADHLGTHLDALNHIAFDNRFYNGVDAFSTITARGTHKLGIETVPPIVTRGVMLDIAGAHGKEVLEGGYAITVEDAETFLDQHDIAVEAGDAVLFHTGRSRMWTDPEARRAYFESSPGVGYELAKWLAERDVAVVGADSAATEVIPSELPGAVLPVHQYLMVKSGIRIIDNLKLDELAADGIYEFLFVCSPLPIKGATASPVAPLAIA